jgi:hypothetical protein
MRTDTAAIRLHRISSGSYTYEASDATGFKVWRVAGLTWQDPDYWIVYENGVLVRHDSHRAHRFTRLHDVRIWLLDYEHRLAAPPAVKTPVTGTTVSRTLTARETEQGVTLYLKMVRDGADGKRRTYRDHLFIHDDLREQAIGILNDRGNHDKRSE